MTYELKCLGILGDEDGDRTEAHFLNRLIRVDKKNGKGSIVIEADRRYVDLLIQAFGLEKANGVEVKKSADQQMLESGPLHARQERGIAVSLSHDASCRPVPRST